VSRSGRPLSANGQFFVLREPFAAAGPC